MPLSLALLGTFQCSAAGQPVPVALSSARALLAYLALESDRPHSRELLAALLWPDQGQATAYTDLRQTLARIRKALTAVDCAAVLTITPQTVQWVGADAAVDAVRFAQLLAACAAHVHADRATCAACLERLAEAAALYHGEFLHGVFMPQSPPFAEWLLLNRERLHRQALDTLHTLTLASAAAGDFVRMRDYAARQLALEPWREEAHLQLMQALAFSGQRTAALAQYATCCRVLEQELGVAPGTEIQAVYERLQAGELSPVAPQAAPAHNLPAQLTPCVGREREIATIVAQLQQSDVRLITLVGAGGMGKTRLALEVARACLPAFADGVFFVALAPLTSAAAIAAAIAAALGLSVRDDPHQAVLHALHTKRLLLMLDNFEHLLDGAQVVIDVLQAAPQVQLLATSREQLNLRGEHLFVVEGLAYAPDTPLAAAAGAAAVRVFEQTARRVQARFELNSANLAAVQRICRLVQGMPLGLELAAPWTATLSLSEIAAEIEQSADFLHTEWRDAPPRQRSLRAVFDWSWALLSTAEQQVFRQLSVFRGSFTRAAAQAVVGAALPVLTSLTHKSVLRWEPSPAGPGRYELHELVRQFAAQHLAACPDECATVEARHAAYYLHFVAEREERLAHHEPRQAAREIRAEIDNVRVAWAWAAAHAQLDVLQHAAYALGHFYMLSGLLAEGEQAFSGAAARVGDTLARPCNDQPEHQRQHGERVWSLLLSLQAMALNLQSAYDQALPLAQHAVALGHTSGGAEGEGMAAIVWGEVLTRRGQLQAARPVFERALRLGRNVDGGVLSEIEWRARIWLGIVAQLADDYAAARHHIGDALGLCRVRHALMGEMTCLHRLATLAVSIGDYTTGRDEGARALDLARALGYPWGEGVAQLRFGQALLGLGDDARAAASLDAALIIFRDIGDRTYEASTLTALGRFADSMGEYARARAQLEQALNICQALHAYEPAFDALVCLSLLWSHMDDHALALTYADQAAPIAHGMGSRLRHAQVLIARSRALRGLHRAAEAEAAAQHARTLSTELGVRVPFTSQPDPN